MGSGSSGTLRATGLSRRSDAIAEAVKRSPKKSDSSSHDRPASALHYFHGRTNLNKIASEGPRKRKNITARNEDAPTSDDSDVPIVSKRKLNDGKPQAVKHETAAERIPTEQASREPANGQKRHATFPRSPAANEKLQRGVKTHKQGEVKSTGPSDQRLGRALATTKKSTIKPAKQPGTSKAKAEAEAEQDLDETYKWWENQAEGDVSVKWTTLEHNGVMFPPPYEPLPKNVKFVYDGVSVGLSEEAEEIATFFGAMLDSQVNMSNPKFVENFFDDFKAAIKESGGAVNRNGARIMVTTIEKCDFKPIYDHFQRKKAEKAALTNAEKKAIKAEKETIETSYAHCIWDGRKEKVGNFRVEPPGLFRGRGDHPKTGRVKKRVRPNQITINIGKGAKVPDPPTGTKWKKIQHDNTVSWLAMWTENINGAFKYVMLAAKSSIKGQSDFKKFEKARELDVSETYPDTQYSIADAVSLEKHCEDPSRLYQRSSG